MTEHTIVYCDGPCKQEINRDGAVKKPYLTYEISHHHPSVFKICCDCDRKFEAWRKGGSHRPTASVLRVLEAALKNAVSADVMRGGGRDFSFEQASDEAKRWIEQQKIQ